MPTRVSFGICTCKLYLMMYYVNYLSFNISILRLIVQFLLFILSVEYMILDHLVKILKIKGSKIFSYKSRIYLHIKNFKIFGNPKQMFH